MTTGATGQLGLALPVQGELSGTWGNTVNNAITEYTNIAIAATLTLTNDGAVTLANTTGTDLATNIVSSLTGAGTVTAQFAIVRVTGTLTTAKVVTAPSYSKTYVVVNAATGGIVTFKASGQTGVSIAVGESAWVYFNGTDYVKLAGTVNTGVTSFQTSLSGLTPSTSTTGAVTLAGTLGTSSGGTNLTSFTSGGVVYASSTSALATSANLTFNGNTLTSSNATGANVIFNSTTNIPYIRFDESGASKLLIGASAVVGGGAGYDFYGASGIGFSFFTNASEKMRLDTSGNLLIGTTANANSAKLKSKVSGGSVGFEVTDEASSDFLVVPASSTGICKIGPTAGGMSFQSAGSERMRIANDGKVGIGVTDVRATLQIGSGNGGGNVPTTSKLMFGANNSIVTFLSDSAGTSVDGVISSYNTVYAFENAKIVFDKPAGNLGQLLFYTNEGSGITERMRILSNGRVGIGTTNPTTPLYVRSTQAAAVVDTLQLSNNASDAGTGSRISFHTADAVFNAIDGVRIGGGSGGRLAFYTMGTGGSLAERARITESGGFALGTTADPGAGAIYATGNITAYYSDARLKTVSGKIENALDKVAQLSGVYYTNNDTAKSFGYDSDEVQVGVLAQDVEAVLPQIVKAAPFDLDENGNSKSGENYKTVQYERLVPLLIEAINELRAEVKALKGV